jgi:hypothetical protein
LQSLGACDLRVGPRRGLGRVGRSIADYLIRVRYRCVMCAEMWLFAGVGIVEVVVRGERWKTL